MLQAAPIILLVDPTNRLRPLLRAVPALAEVQLHAVARSVAAVEAALRTHDPVAVVLDVEASDDASWEVLLAIRQLDPERQPPVILTTGLVPGRVPPTGYSYYLSQSALMVRADRTGVEELVERIRRAVGER